jgi:ankyrin repeat protein
MQYCLTENSKEIFFEILQFNTNIASENKNYLLNIFSTLVQNQNCLEKIKWVIEYDQNILNQKDEHGNTPILLASMHNNIPAFEYLVEFVVNTDGLNNNHENCFFHAVKNQNKQIIRKLFGEEYFLKPYLITAIIFFGYDLEFITKVIELNDSFINQVDTSTNETPLYFACKKVNGSEISLDLVTRLLESGADQSIPCGITKETCLHIACEYGNVDLIKLLIRYGGYSNGTDINGETSLFKAVRNENLSVVEVLLEEDVNIYAENRNGNSALEIASKSVKGFILKKLNITMKNLNSIL